MAKAAGRVQPCSLAEARSRLRQAEAFVEVAEAVVVVDDDVATPGVAAALAVLAGRAASDAACCAKLKARPRGQNHLDAVPFLASVRPHGAEMSKNLSRLLQRKDDAHYGLSVVSAADAAKMLGWAKRIVRRSQQVLDTV